MFLTRAQVRAVDRRALDEFGVPTLVLMENAGRGAADVLTALGVRGSVVVCCGKGNNGGDGFVVARHLHNRGVDVRILLFARPEEVTGDAATNYTVVQRSGIPLDVRTAVEPDELRRADWVVDALFGTGLTGPLRPPFAAVVEAINASGARVLALDIPSGLDCDTGVPLGVAVRAAHTVTFVAPKQGFANPASRGWTGLVHVVDIGAPRVAIL